MVTRRRTNLAALAAAFLVAAQVAISLHAYWHHDHEDRSPDSSCLVCAAQSSSGGDGLEARPVILVAQPIGRIEEATNSRAESLALGVLRCRGPPALT